MLVCHFGFGFPASEESHNRLHLCPLLFSITRPKAHSNAFKALINFINWSVITTQQRISDLTHGFRHEGSIDLAITLAGKATYQTSRPPEFKNLLRRMI